MINWSEREIYWYADAEVFNGYFDRLAAMVATQLPPQATLHDVGCGTGGLAVRLAAYGFSLVAVDINPQAIHWVAERASADTLPITTLLADYTDLTEQIEYPVFCLCGDFPNETQLLQRWQARRAVVITLDDTLLSFKLSDTPRKAPCSGTLEQYLVDKGYSYQLQRLATEFGQPFRLAEDAEEFIGYHNRTATRDEVAHFCNENLVQIDHGVYRYFLPSTKRVSIFTVEL